MNIEEIYEFCLALPDVTEDFPFDEQTLVFKTHGKIFLLCGLDAVPLRINLKCQPDLAEELRADHEPHITGGYHMNKKHWNTVYVESLPADLVKKMIVHSYEEILKKLPLKVRKELKYRFENPFSNSDLE